MRKYLENFLSHKNKLKSTNKKNTSFFIHFLSYLLNSSLTSPPFWRNLSRRATSVLLHFSVFVSNVSSESEQEREREEEGSMMLLRQYFIFSLHSVAPCYKSAR